MGLSNLLLSRLPDLHHLATCSGLVGWLAASGRSVATAGQEAKRVEGQVYFSIYVESASDPRAQLRALVVSGQWWRTRPVPGILTLLFDHFALLSDFGLLCSSSTARHGHRRSAHHYRVSLRLRRFRDRLCRSERHSFPDAPSSRREFWRSISADRLLVLLPRS